MEDVGAIVTRPERTFLHPRANARLIISSPHSTFRSPRVSRSYDGLRAKLWEAMEDDDDIGLPSSSGLRIRDDDIQRLGPTWGTNPSEGDVLSSPIEPEEELWQFHYGLPGVITEEDEEM